MRRGDRKWTRVFATEDIEDGGQRIAELPEMDLVVARRGERFIAFNNACPHMRLPFFDRNPPSEGAKAPPVGNSELTDNMEVRCRWHGSCFDLETGEINSWCDRLNEDGTSKGMEHLGDISKNRTPLDPIECRVEDGQIWVSVD